MANETSLPGRVNYTLWSGDTWTPGTITVSMGGTPINFTGWAAAYYIRTTTTKAAVKTLSSGAGITLSSLGVITLTMTAAEVALLNVGDYTGTLKCTSPTGAVSTWVHGTVSVTDDETAAADNSDVTLTISQGADVTITLSGGGGYASPSATAIVDGTTVALPANKQVLSIAVTAAAGSRTLTVGTSAAATDVIDSEVIPTNTDQNLPVGIFTSTGLTLHFSGFIGTVRVYIL